MKKKVFQVLVAGGLLALLASYYLNHFTHSHEDAASFLMGFGLAIIVTSLVVQRIKGSKTHTGSR